MNLDQKNVATVGDIQFWALLILSYEVAYWWARIICLAFAALVLVVKAKDKNY